MMLKEGDTFTILDSASVRNKYFKYFKIKYWDGKNWIVRFIDNYDTDWIALNESEIFRMLNLKAIRYSKLHEKLEAIILELKISGDIM